MKNSKQCSAEYEGAPDDKRILDMFKMPDPTMCFDCRNQRRLAFYNRRKLYKRKCDLTGEDIISVMSPDKPFKIYNVRDWFSDKWDPLEYGREFDFNRPFFEQFRELMEDVPQIALALLGDNINSDYTNDNYKLKNCYLIFDGEEAQDCYYGETFMVLKNCMDFLLFVQSELSYEVMGAGNCYNLKFSRYCNTCSDSWFLMDCKGCKNCFGCVNLYQKEYHIFNEPHTKEEYEKFMAEFDSGNYEAVQKMKKKVEEFYKTQPTRATRSTTNNINVVGDTIINSKDCYYCFESLNLQDCRYCTNVIAGAKDCMDVHAWGDRMERCYNSCLVGAGSMNVFMSAYCALGVTDLYYSYWCTRNAKNLFGCIGLRQKEYCILNKQYTKGEYEALMPKIIEHMKSTGEWGEFFPPEISPFGYNETIAQDIFPLDKEGVLSNGWQWCDFEPEIQAEKTISADKLPNDIKDVPDDILNWAIICEKSGKPFKLIPQELNFYRDHKLPVPRRHPDQRHWDRMSLRNPYKLWDRQCDKCKAEVKSSCSPERPEIIYCEQCYLKEVY